jgi:hypothetical protein
MQKRFLFLASYTSRPREYKPINNLLLFSSSLSTRQSMRGGLTSFVDRIVDRFVAAIHLCLDISSCAETTKCASEVETKCAGPAVASGTLQTYVHTVSGD